MSEEVRLIDANELLRNIAKHAYLISHDNGISIEYGMSCFGILQCIAEAKTIDAVPVVRCKNCKYIIDSDCKWDEYQSNERNIEKDFCSFGERKE